VPLGADGLPAEGETTARGYLCCIAERDLTDLLPVLPSLGRRSFRPAIV
jgi:hypothetical protein